MENSGILNWRQWPPVQKGAMLGVGLGFLLTTCGYVAHILAVLLEPRPGEGKLIVIMLDAIWLWSVYPFSMLWKLLEFPWPMEWDRPKEIWRLYCAASITNILGCGILGIFIGCMIKDIEGVSSE